MRAMRVEETLRRSPQFARKKLDTDPFPSAHPPRRLTGKIFSILALSPHSSIEAGSRSVSPDFPKRAGFSHNATAKVDR